jgi:hypothetical protein
MNKLKFKSNSQILKLNNKIYIPFLIHNLPNYFHKINPINIIKINTTIYINSIEFTKTFMQDYYNDMKNIITKELELHFVIKNYNILSIDKGKCRHLFSK